MDAWISDRPQKQAPEKKQSTFDSGVVVISLLMELLVGNENILCHCVHMWRFGKANHI